MVTDNYILDLSKQSNFEFSFNSVIGTRFEQQDFFGIKTTEEYIFSCVCDGIGGMKCGARASSLTVSNFMHSLNDDQIKNSPCDFFKNILDSLDDAIYNMKNSDGKRIDSGTTLAAIFISNRLLSWLAVGDSTLFILRDNNITKINRAHNYQLLLEEQLSTGIIDESTYTKEMYDGEALISYIGIGNINIFDVSENPLRLLSGDIIILATDGLTKILADKEICSLVSNKSPKEAIDLLIKTAAKRSIDKSQDNTTAVIIKIN